VRLILSQARGPLRASNPSRRLLSLAAPGPPPLRCDWGPQYIADAWINEVKWLGITITPSYVGEPQCNGVTERFMRTLKEQCLYLHRFETLDQARALIAEFIARYNTQWLIERLGHRTPAQARAEALRRAA
jgi:putative transposase